ncbi:Glycosyltransferase involved in cell wall bisynthesis [Halogranum rubrum]|uniref:Glycosyltransferase involved in cell wall bisynthesis n=1 Tax=Halogranum rubrum TaxID=553466 RepID=A0A1I4B9N8_9EURY|nr:glycosyltransferase family 4 protein [Halogranum rubrum]SFK65213.1 Glycosyltransferase involved in cell wall bisynthesis [Halogranum rubrum]
MVTHSRVLLRSHTPLYVGEPNGGAPYLMENLAAALGATGWEIHLLCPAADRSLSTPAGVTAHTFDYQTPTTATTKMLHSVRGLQQFRRLMKAYSFDVILDDISHIPFYPAHLLCPSETVNACFMHTAFFETARRFSGPLRGRVVEAIDRTLPYLNQPEIVCAGESTEATLRDRLGHTATHVLNPCVELDAFSYQFDPQSTEVLYLGRLSKRKNAQLLLTAWQEIERRYPNHSLTIAGTGPQEDYLKETARTLGLERVSFRGFVSPTEKHRLYRDALVFVLPSLLEGYVTTGLEALASGTPVVGADVPGIHDYVVDGETGLLFESDDAAALATTLATALSDPAGLEPLAERGRALAAAHSYSSFKQRADALFSTLAEKSPSRPS